MKNFIKNILIAFVVFLTVASIFAMYKTPLTEPEEISLNQLVTNINEGSVEKIEVGGNELKIKLRNDDKEKTTKKEEESSLSETLKNYGVESDRLSQVEVKIVKESGAAYWLGNLLPFMIPFIFIAVFIYFMARSVQKGNNRAMMFGQSGAKKFESQQKNKTNFKDVAGVKEAKEELWEVVEFLKQPKKFRDLGAEIPKGVLLVGPPGTGKTLMARAVAGEANVPFFHISGSEFVEMFVGVGASVSGDTKVLIKSEDSVRLIPIADFVDQYYESKQAGFPVSVSGVQTLGYKGKNNKTNKSQNKFFGGSSWQNIEGVFRHKVDKIYEIHYLGGVVETTGDHSIFVRDKNRIIVKKAADLQPGDILVNLPFKVRGKYLPDIGTQHHVRAHEFSQSTSLELNVWNDDPAWIAKYDFALANQGMMSQCAIASEIGVSQATVGNWQRGVAYPQSLSREVYKSKLNLPQNVKVIPELMRLLGYYTAEGRCTRYYVEFVFGAHEKELHRDCISLMQYIFNLEPQLELTEDNSLRIKYSSVPLSDFFEQHCSTGSHEKHVPEFIWELPRTHFLAYLDGCIKGDGYTTKEGKLSLTSVSQQLIAELQWLCAMHGVKAGVRKMTLPAGRVIKNKPLPGGIAWNLIIGKTSDPFSGNKIQFPDQIKKPYVKKIVQKPYHGYVYDLCGCDNEAFFGGEKPILLHNSRVRDLFNKAKKAAPAILFIDEIDAVGRQRGAGLGGSHDEREQTLNQILTEMDGFEQNSNVIVVAATNRPDVLDPALLRPGRFDRRITLNLPDIKDREALIKIHAQGKVLVKNINFKKVAQRTPGFSGADVKNLMNEAAILAARKNKKIIGEKDVLESIEKVMMGPERKSFVLSEQEKKIAAYHEAGHALVSHLLPHTDPVHKISIISRGQAAGYTLKLPEKEKHFHAKQEFIEDLSVLLGGYVAEKIVFGDVTTGATSDLRGVTDLSRKLVTEYGMSDKLGPMTFGQKDDMVFLGRDIAEQRDYSEEVAAEIDKEIKKFVDIAYATTEKVLQGNREKLELVAKTLITKETLEREDFEKLVGEK